MCEPRRSWRPGANREPRGRWRPVPRCEPRGRPKPRYEQRGRPWPGCEPRGRWNHGPRGERRESWRPGWGRGLGVLLPHHFLGDGLDRGRWLCRRPDLSQYWLVGSLVKMVFGHSCDPVNVDLCGGEDTWLPNFNTAHRSPAGDSNDQVPLGPFFPAHEGPSTVTLKEENIQHQKQLQKKGLNIPEIDF